MIQKDLSARTAILWDLDNTLYRLDDRLEHAINLAVAQAAIELGADLALADAQALARQSWLAHRSSAVEFMQRYALSREALHFATDRYLAGTGVAKDPEICALFEGAAQVHAHALITHSARPWALRALDALALRPWFPDASVFAYEDFDFQSKAQSPHAFEQALRALGKAPEQAIMVEDTLENLRIPHAMGLATVFLHYGHPPEEMPAFVDSAFANAAALLRAL